MDDNNLSFSQLIQLLESTAQAKRFTLILNHLDLLEDGRDLLEVLPSLPPKQRLELIQRQADKIRPGYDLVYILHSLEPEDRLVYARKYSAKLQNGCDLVGVLHELPQDCQSNYLLEHFAKIKTPAELSWALAIFKQEELLEFIQTHPELIQTSVELEIVFAKLSRENCLKLVMAQPKMVQDGRMLSQILKMLSPDQRLDFIMQHQGIIDNIPDLASILYKLPSSARQALIEKNANLIQTPEDLYTLMRTLSFPDRLDFILMHQQILAESALLSRILKKLPHLAAKTELDSPGNLLAVIQDMGEFPQLHALALRCLGQFRQDQVLSFADLIPDLATTHPQALKLYILKHLEEHYAKKQWPAYWQTANLLPEFKLDWEALRTNPEFLASLAVEKHAKVFLKFTTPGERQAHLSDIFSHHPEHAAKILKILQMQQQISKLSWFQNSSSATRDKKSVQNLPKS